MQMSARKVFTWCANTYTEQFSAFLMVSGLAKMATIQKDEQKSKFIRQYPFSSFVFGTIGTTISATVWPVSYIFIDKQIYLFGGFPFNLLTVNQWKMRITSLPNEQISTYLHTMVCDYEKAFPESLGSFSEK